MNKQFLITFKQFLLFLLLSQGVMAFGMVAAVISGSAKGLEKEEMLGYALSSRITACSMILGYVLTIAVFLGRRYVKVKLGRIERDRLWPMAGMAALIALGWMFTEVGILQLFDADKLFADDLEELKELEKLMSGPLGAIAVGLLAPIAEEIGFRGVLLVGHVGKLVKLAGGMMNTHSRYGDCRMEIMAAHAAAAGARAETAGQILDCATCDDALRLLKEESEKLCRDTLARLTERIAFHLNHRAGETMPVETILFSRVYGRLDSTAGAGDYLKIITEG